MRTGQQTDDNGHMTTLGFISPEGEKITVTAPCGQSLMEIAVENDIPGIDADCEGGCACATCHILIPDIFRDAVPPMDEDEEYLLDFLDNRRRNSRLSCQIKMTDRLDGMTVTVPEQP